ncbi:peptide alpha-n-acetyltransferase [Sporothrix brasiliensis 5110]|uniref:Peptide alpha-n-acetyltransferase n=1 Tax=Sporothrix brasiliensis 5110 TaxID=1398154 RepID=A0A0C2J831_9PEZI|nr:peptide alpha-n-acetyltransferase [Sporothrix brasiliensis 5110]KIH93137.1 peptide alpha-n-acetyltransferase [Sporothrix brasiliensis 5110]
MLRRSVRALDVLLQQPSAQPAMLVLQQRGGAAAARNGVAQAGKQVWRRPATRSIASSTPKAPTTSATHQFRSSTFFTRAPPRRTFHSSRTRRSHDGAKGGAGDAAGPKSGPGAAPAEKLTLSQRFKKLSREYGWTAVGVYFGLSLLDFPFCFLLVRTLGTDRIAAAEEYVVGHVKVLIPESVKERWRRYRAALKEAQRESGVAAAQDAIADAAKDVVAHDKDGQEVAAGDGWGVKEADRRNKHEASLATQLALAYAIHKSFIFVRVPLAAAVTPQVVKVLRSWGWKIGKAKPA